MPSIRVPGGVIYPMGPTTRALKLDDPAVAKRFREWWRETDRTTMIATTTSITGPDDGGIPIVYFGAKSLVESSSLGDRATILVETRDRRDGRRIETTDLRLL